MTERKIIITADPTTGLWAKIHEMIADPDIETITIDCPTRAVITFDDGGSGTIERSGHRGYAYRADGGSTLYTCGSVLGGRD